MPLPVTAPAAIALPILGDAPTDGRPRRAAGTRTVRRAATAPALPVHPVLETDLVLATDVAAANPHAYNRKPAIQHINARNRIPWLRAPSAPSASPHPSEDDVWSGNILPSDSLRRAPIESGSHPLDPWRFPRRPHAVIPRRRTP